MRFLLGLSFALLCIFPVYASEAPADGYLSDEEIASVVGDDADGGVIYDEDGNVVYSADGIAPSAAAGDLKYAPYIGSCWIKGTASGLGEVYIYVPVSSRGKWGTTSSGYLCNVDSSSVSGIMFNSQGTQYAFTCSGFSVPRYRLFDSSSYQYSDLYVTVTDSNAQVATSFPPSVPVADVLPYVTVVLLMGVILCSMRSRH